MTRGRRFRRDGCAAWRQRALANWVPTPPAFAAYLLPQWGDCAPFAMTEHAQFRPAGPPPLDSGKWAADYNEVKALGAAVGSTRTPDQTEIARFWADGAGTETLPGHWNHIAQEVAAAQGNTLEQNARLFALLNLAMADAGICAWDAKYNYHNWRPSPRFAMATPMAIPPQNRIRLGVRLS